MRRRDVRSSHEAARACSAARVRVRVRVRVTVTVTVTVRITVRVRVRDRVSSGLQLGCLRGLGLATSRSPSH